VESGSKSSKMKASMKREDICNYAFYSLFITKLPSLLPVFLCKTFLIVGCVVSPRVRSLLLKPHTGFSCYFFMRYSTVDKMIMEQGFLPHFGFTLLIMVPPQTVAVAPPFRSLLKSQSKFGAPFEPWHLAGLRTKTYFASSSKLS
jgi:hypothetical protein